MNQQGAPPLPEADATESTRAEISREMVRLYKDLFGRGPTKVRTEFAGPDTVICTLRESLTPAEQAMVAMGEHQRLRDTRMFFQHATEEEFRGTVERILERPVQAFVSGIDTGQDVSVEIFYLEPKEDQPHLGNLLPS